MKHVQRGNKELVCILLLVAGQVSGMSPNQMKQTMQGQRSFVTRVKLEKCQQSVKKKHNFLLVILFHLPLEINVIFRRRDNDQVPLETDRRDGPIGNNP
jgi:hypothetical protein